jgi:hypothetical protein
MKIIRLLAFALAASLLAPSAANAARAHTPEQRLVGIWQDSKDPENIIQFFPDHSVRIYLPKRDGQALDAHWMTGTWALAPGGKLTLRLNVLANPGMTSIRNFTIVFTRRGFTVKAKGKVVGEQRRISEKTLKKHLW